LATYVSHNRVSQIAKQYGDTKLSKACKMIAGDEMRHHHAYSEFINQIFKVDPSEMMLAFQYMMKQKITMPAHFLRESGQSISSVFNQFSDSAQKLGVYTANDYVDIMQKLLDKWSIDKISGLTDEAEKARDYLMRLPARMAKISERLVLPDEDYIFKWVQPALVR
jgi:acyl-[acyl-carrier-protein] desaturase